MTLLTPPNYFFIDDKLPYVYLAGPIQGASNWHDPAYDILVTLNSQVVVASPVRQGGIQGRFSDEDFQEQVKWEQKHIKIALKRRGSCLLFWLANEVQPIPGRAFAQTTRLELAEALVFSRIFGCSLVVGIDTRFSGKRYILTRLRMDFPHVPVFWTLNETCEYALAIAQSQLQGE